MATAPAATVVIPDGSASDLLFSTVAPTPDADTKGMWGPVAAWPHIAIHASLLPKAGAEGVVLTHGATASPRSASGTDLQGGIDFNEWNPVRGLGFDPSYAYSLASPVDPANPAHRVLTDPIRFDSFCSSTKMLSDGTLLIAGGNNGWYGDQTRSTAVYDPVTEQMRAMLQSLAYPRWYASLVRLPDDRMVLVGGGEAYVNVPSIVPEVFSSERGWVTLPKAASVEAFGSGAYEWWYPRAYLAPSGEVFGISHRQMWRLDPDANGGAGSTRLVGRIETDNVGAAGTSVMFDHGKILLAGGGQIMNEFYGQRGSNQASVIDISVDTPLVKPTASMTYRRNWPTAAALPTGDVLVAGGAEWGNADDSHAVAGDTDSLLGYPAYAPEIWNPVTERWTIGASQQRVRVYHSSLLLLPNGTLLSAGGGVPGPQDNRNAEIYYPPYLFKRQDSPGGGVVWASRPKMSRISDNVGYGNTVRLSLSDARVIDRMTLISLGAVTHGHSNDQRVFTIRNRALAPSDAGAFTQRGNELVVPLPADDRRLPPGWYMMHVVDDAGVPSRGFMVEIKGKGAA